MTEEKTTSEAAKDFIRRLFTPPAPKHRLPLGRCACAEPSVRWCTRHGKPLRLPLNPR